MPSAVSLPAYSGTPDLQPLALPATNNNPSDDEARLRAARIAAAAAQWQGMGSHGSTAMMFTPRAIPAPANSIFVVAKLSKIRAEPALLDAYKSLLRFPPTVPVGGATGSRHVRTLHSTVRALTLNVDEWDALNGRPTNTLALRVRVSRQQQQQQQDDAPGAPELVGGDAFDSAGSASSASTIRSVASLLPDSPHSSIQDALNNLDDLTTNDLLPESHPADDQHPSNQNQELSLDADPTRLPPPPPRYECATGSCSRSKDTATKAKRRPSFPAVLPALQPGMAYAHAGDQYHIGHARLTTVVADYKSPRLAHLQHHVHLAFPEDHAALSVAHVPGMVDHLLRVIAHGLANKYKVQAAGSASGFVFSSTKHEVGDMLVVSVPKEDVTTRLAIKALDVFESCPSMEDDSSVASYVVDLSELIKD